MDESFHLTIYTPEGIYLETDCKELSSRNILGDFNVLPSHTNFITNINNNILFTTTDDKETEIPVQMGVLRVSENNMEIYLVLSSILAPTER